MEIYTRTVQSHFTLLILSRVAFLLPPLPPRRLHLCAPPPEPSATTIQSSTFTFSTPPPRRARAHYAADTLLRPIEIFIPARLPSQFMPRTSEMYCYRRSTGFYYAIFLHLPSPLLRRESGREISTSVSLPLPSLFGIFQFSSVFQWREAAKYDLLHGR